MRLLAEDEPHPTIVRAGSPACPFVLVADHAGNAIPRTLGNLGLSETDRARHIAWDIGIAGVADVLAAKLGYRY